MLLLGEQPGDWKQVRKVIMNESFIADIINFNTDNISNSARKQMTEK